ncbi:MAG: hypothetical protein ACP5OG_05725 [Candidatus Nanoarchaeia archaeon]
MKKYEKEDSENNLKFFFKPSLLKITLALIIWIVAPVLTTQMYVGSDSINIGTKVVKSYSILDFLIAHAPFEFYFKETIFYASAISSYLFSCLIIFFVKILVQRKK